MRVRGAVGILMAFAALSSCAIVETESSESMKIESSSYTRSIPDDNVVNVVIMAGQSNMVGVANAANLPYVGRDENVDYSEGFPVRINYYNCTISDGRYTLISDSAGFVDRVVPGQGEIGCFGPELGFAKYVSENFSGDVAIIKCACGAARLDVDWGSPSFDVGPAPMYSKLKEMVDSSMAALSKEGRKPLLKAICWLQGESEAAMSKSDVYKGWMQDFVSDLRTEYGHYNPDGVIGFIDAGISDSYLWTQYAEINQIKKELSQAMADYVFIDTLALGCDSTTLNQDYAHYATRAMLKIGKAFGECAIDYLLR